MNTYFKYAPNVFLAKCKDQHTKGDTIVVTTKHGKEHEVIVFNLIGKHRDGDYVYSIVRADGYNAQERAKAKAERLARWAESAKEKGEKYYQASKEGADFLALGEPIKVGHHSEKRHRALIERNQTRFSKFVEQNDKAEAHLQKAEYWASRADDINLSMPESLEFYAHEVERLAEIHKGMKDGSIPRDHSMSLQYASKNLKEARQKHELAQKLWGE